MIHAKVVKAEAPDRTEECDFLRDSHPSPLFVEPQASLTDVQFDESRGIRGRLHLSGKVTSDLCDLVPGDEGMIREIGVYVNGAFLRSIPTQVMKSSAQTSFTHPFPMLASFDVVLDDVEWTTGQNWIELQATDSVPAVRLTGAAEFRTIINADKVEIASTQKTDNDSKSPQPPSTAKESWRFSFQEPSLVSKTNGGETHPYYVRLTVTPQLLEALPIQYRNNIVLGGDGHYYVGNTQSGPDANLLIILGGNNSTVEGANFTNKTFEWGFVSGLVSCGARFVGNTLSTGFTSRNGDRAIATLVNKVPDPVTSEITLMTNYELPSSVSQSSRAIKSLYRFSRAVNDRQYEIIESVARGDWRPFCDESKELMTSGVFALEVLEEVWKEYGKQGNLPACGYLQGQVCVEVLACILAGPKHGTMSKIDVLTKLRSTQTFQQIKKGTLLEKVIGLWRSSPFGSFS